MNFKPMQFTQGDLFRQRQYQLGDDNKISYTTTTLYDHAPYNQFSNAEHKEKTPIYPEVYIIENLMTRIVESCESGNLPQEIICADGVIRGLSSEIYSEIPEELMDRPFDKVQYQYVGEGLFYQFIITKVGDRFRIIKWNCEYTDQEAAAANFETKPKKGDTRKFTQQQIDEILGRIAA